MKTKFAIYTTIDGSGASKMPESFGWIHGRIVAGHWKEIQYKNAETAQKALNGPQFEGRGAFATEGTITLYPQA